MKKSTSLLFSLLLTLVGNIATADFPDALKQHYYPAVIKPHHIKLNAPQIAEQSSHVPIRIESIQRPEQTSHITDITFYLSHDTSTPAASFKLNATTMAEGLSARMRMPHGKNILYSVAKLSDGSVVGGEVTVKVVYACNGGF